MQGYCRETEILSSLVLNHDILIKLEEIVKEIENNINYDSAPLWELQSLLIPSHPHDSMKDIMTPLQCARDEIEICNLNCSGNYVILYCQKYLEGIVRYFLSIIHPVMRLKYKVTPYGSLIHKLDNLSFVPKELSEGLKEIFKLCQRCGNLENTAVSPKDAVFTYICSMLIGTRLLTISDSHIKRSEEKCLNTLYKIDLGS
ncbi:MAG: hypothetical protein Q8930_06205 [Bacillota bacterium]|nr:hypothetical protein [Bacillota bacterium]